MNQEIRKNIQGFTLVEMVVIMIILGILGAIAIPTIGNTINELRLGSATQNVVSDIRYAKEMALSLHKTTGLEFDSGANSYTVFEVNGGVKSTVTDPHTGAAMTLDFDTEVGYGGVAIGALSLCVGVCGTDELRFSSFGVPMDANDVEFAVNSTIQLLNGTLSRTIQVIPETGLTETL